MATLYTTPVAPSASTPPVRWFTSPSHVPFRPCRRHWKACQRATTHTSCSSRFVSSAKRWLARCVDEWTLAPVEFTLVGLARWTFVTYKTHDGWYWSPVVPQCTAVLRFDRWWSSFCHYRFKLRTPRTLLTASHALLEPMWCSSSPSPGKRRMCWWHCSTAGSVGPCVWGLPMW